MKGVLSGSDSDKSIDSDISDDDDGDKDNIKNEDSSSEEEDTFNALFKSMGKQIAAAPKQKVLVLRIRFGIVNDKARKKLMVNYVRAKITDGPQYIISKSYKEIEKKMKHHDN